jgi:hypothetical protein
VPVRRSSVAAMCPDVAFVALVVGPESGNLSSSIDIFGGVQSVLLNSTAKPLVVVLG